MVDVAGGLVNKHLHAKGPDGCREQFLERGFFSFDLDVEKHTVEDCRKIVAEDLRRLHGVDVADPNTWPETERIGLDVSYDEERHPSIKYVKSSVYLDSALDVVLGDDIKCVDFDLGWWVINFPMRESNVEWSPQGRRHIDGSHFAHTLNLSEIGIKLLFLFNDVELNCGGTVLYAGSHKHVSQTLASFSFTDGFKGTKSTTLIHETLRRFPAACEEPVQATGRAGTVYVLHPHLVHSRSANLSEKAEAGIRYLALPSVSLTTPLHWGGNGDGRGRAGNEDSSALRLSLRRAYCRARERRQRNRKRRRTY